MLLLTKGDGKIYEFALGPVGPPPAPTADFTGSPTSDPISLTVDFSNTSTGLYTTCLWDFGDGGGSSSCSASVSYDYNFGGVFTVSLTVSGTGGSSTETKTGYITMYQASAAAFEGTPTSGLVSLSVSFSNQTEGKFDTWLWKFGDGETSSECDNLHRTYTSPGIYTVDLFMDGPSSSVAARKIDYITVEPHLIRLPLILGN